MQIRRYRRSSLEVPQGAFPVKVVGVLQRFGETADSVRKNFDGTHEESLRQHPEMVEKIAHLPRLAKFTEGVWEALQDADDEIGGFCGRAENRVA